MKRNIWITIIAILAFATIPASAQLGNLKKAIKKKAEANREEKRNSGK